MNFRPKKSLGQNFLKNPHVLDKIIEAAALKGDETVLEIGPGFGILTERLLLTAKKVIAIEKDNRLYEWLNDPRSTIRVPRLKLLHADALKVPPPTSPYVLIANIPYYITSPLLDHYIRDNPQNLPQRAVLLVQKEVAEKICSQPPHMNVLALHVQTFGTPKIISVVSKNNFEPRPKVDSAIIKIEFYDEWRTISDLKKYFDVIHRGFSHKRKMMRSMFNENTLQRAKIDPMRRAETLLISEWESLSKQK